MTDDAMPTTAPSKPFKIIAAALAFAAALALAYASFSGEWLRYTAEDDEEEASAPHASSGLRSMTLCAPEGADDHEMCVTMSLSGVNSYLRSAGNTDAASTAFSLSGWVTSIALWLAAAALIASAALMLAGKFIARPITPTTVAFLSLAVGLMAGVVFVANRPGREWSAGAGVYGYVPGELAGIIATLMLARIRPKDPEWDDPQPFDEEKWEADGE